MQAVQTTQFGGPQVLVPGDAPEPAPGPDQVVVRVSAAEVLFLDTQLRAGWGREFFDLEPPFVPGAGVAGTVTAVGDDGDRDWIGRRVVAGTAGPGEYAGGGYAEYAAVPLGEVHDVPDGLDLHVALAALHDGSTAVGRVELAAIRPGERVLVSAAGGSLGAWLVPLAKAAGAHVVAAARGAHKLEHARGLGADLAVDYSEPGWADRVGDAVDVVFDGAGGEIGLAAFEITAPGGRFFSYGAASGDFAAIDPREAERRRVRVVGIHDGNGLQDRRRLTERALAEVAAGRIEPIIGQAVPLGRAADAHAAIEARRITGKTVLVVR